MPVHVACSCGKQLNVPDEYAGRNVRCPACKNVLLAPAAAVEAASVQMRCDACGKELKTRAEYAGRQIACPGCNTTLTVPGAAVLPPLPAPPPMPVSSRTPSVLPADDAEEPTPRRRRPAPQRRVWPWVAAAAALLLLVGGGLAVWYFALRDSTPADLRLVPADAQGFAAVRVADVWKSDDMKKMLTMMPPDMRSSITEKENEFGMSVADIERATVVTNDLSDNTSFWVIFLFSKSYDRQKLLDKLAPGTTEISQGKHKYHGVEGDDKKPILYFHTDRILVLGNKKGVTACLNQIDNRKSDGPLKAALKEAAGNRHLVAAGVPPADLIDKMRQNMPPNTSHFTPLLEAKVVMLAADLAGKTQSTELTLSFADNAKAAQAKDAAEALKSTAVLGLAQFKGQMAGPAMPPDAKMMFDKFEAILIGTKVEQKKDAVVVSVKVDESGGATTAIMTGLMLPAVQKVREASERMQGSNNLKQLALAFHMFHDTMNGFPPQTSFNERGQPALSWRVHILPYLEQQPLYNEFHLNEAWDSPHNITLLSRMPKTFRTPNQAPGDTNTHYQVFVGKDAPFTPMFQQGAAPLFAQRRGMTSITDGTSNTIAIVEATRAVPWTKPEDVPFVNSPQGFSPAVLGLPGASTFTAALFDGSVRSFKKTANPIALQAWITPNGGEIVGEP